MTILLEDFMRTATDEQLELLHNLNETARTRTDFGKSSKCYLWFFKV